MKTDTVSKHQNRDQIPDSNRLLGQRDREIEKLKAALDQMRVERDRLESLVRYSALAVVEVNTRGEVIRCNENFERMLGYTQTEIMGRDLDELVASGSSRDEARGNTEKTMSGVPIFGTGVRKRKNGTHIDVAYFGAPVIIGDEIIGAYGVYQDITPKVVAEKKLSEAYQELYEKNRRLMRFNNLTLGREQRMMQLKSEVNDVLEKMGQKTKYRTPVEAEPDIDFTADVNGQNKGLEASLDASLNVMEDLEQKQIELDGLLKVKDALLSEIHHRVKNNMQIISSLLSLQSRQVEDPYVSDLFQDAQNRIRALAILHERLYRSEDFQQIDFQQYIQDIAKTLFRSYTTGVERVNMDIQAAALSVGMGMAIPCGLILSELISNSMKHAFPGKREGNIVIKIDKAGNDRNLQLTFKDDGIGFPESVDPNRPQTLGLKLIRILARQLKGSVEVDQSKGTEYRIQMKTESS